MDFFKWITRVFEPAPSPAAPTKAQSAVVSTRDVPAGFRYLKASALLELEKLQSLQEMLALDASLFHPEGHIPALLIFISHRWESPVHPDPAAHQLKVVQYVLRNIPRVAALLNAPAAERLRQLPTLRVHGVIQAALLVASTDDDDQSADNIWQDWAQLVKHTAATDLLAHIGVWYDYACMPQATAGPDKRGESALFQSLTRLPDLVRSSAILMIREDKDDYTERGWCASEVAAGRRDNQLIVVRKDLLGTAFHDDDLFPLSKKSAEDWDEGTAFVTSQLFKNDLDNWESATAQRVGLWGLYLGFAGLKAGENSRRYPLFTTKPNPDAFPQQRAILQIFQQTLGRLSELDKQGNLITQPFDLAQHVRTVLHKVGLKCTEQWDVVFVGLSILRSRHHPSLVPDIHHFYQTAIERWVKGQSINLIRYRESMNEVDSWTTNLGKWEAWYLFEGETANARQKPHWVT